MKTSIYVFNGVTEYYDTLEEAQEGFKSTQGTYVTLGVEVIDDTCEVTYTDLMIKSSHGLTFNNSKDINSEAARIKGELKL